MYFIKNGKLYQFRGKRTVEILTKFIKDTRKSLDKGAIDYFTKDPTTMETAFGKTRVRFDMLGDAFRSNKPVAIILASFIVICLLILAYLACMICYEVGTLIKDSLVDETQEPERSKVPKIYSRVGRSDQKVYSVDSII